MFSHFTVATQKSSHKVFRGTTDVTNLYPTHWSSFWKENNYNPESFQKKTCKSLNNKKSFFKTSKFLTDKDFLKTKAF